MKRRFNNKGFTLVELIVVIAVLAIITVVAAPQFIKYVEKARIGTDANAAGEVAHAAEIAFVANKEQKGENYVKMQIRINMNGGALYQAPNSELVKEVKQVIPEDSYIYKSDLYKGKTVEIEIDPDTGVATWLPPRLNWTPSHNGIIGDILTNLGVTDEQKDKLDVIISNGFTSLDEFLNLGENGMVDYIEGAMNEINNNGCVATGSLVTLADGSLKKVEELSTEDKVLAYDHVTGEYVEGDILAIIYHGDKFRHVMNLEFSNGSGIKLIERHDLFDLTLNGYVELTNDNFTDFIGHEFAMQSADGYEKAVLESAFLSYEYTGSYAVITEGYMNSFTNGFFTNLGGVEIAANVFEFDSDLKYNAEKMQQDVETYGLYEYEDFAHLVGEKAFEALPFEYIKVGVEKGIVTSERVAEVLKMYAPYLELIEKNVDYIEYYN